MNRSELRRKHFHIFAVITLILAVLFVWADIWTDLRIYENSDDDDVMAAFCTRLAEEARRGSCSRLLSDSGFRTNYLTLDHEGQTLASVVRGKELTYVKDEEEDGLYRIYAGEDLLAEVTLDVSDHYGLLKLPIYSVVSINGTKTCDYAVKSPRNMFIGDTSLQTLTPIETSLAVPELSELAQSTVDVQVPDYLVYHADDMFAVPSLSSRSTPSYFYPMKEIDGGIMLVGDYPEYELTDELREKTTAFAEALSRFKAGDSDWEGVKEYIMESGTIYSDLEAMGAEAGSAPTEFDMGEVEIAGSYGWTPSLVSVDAKYCYTVKNGDEEIRTDEDLTLYYYLEEEGGQWKICYLADHNAPAKQPAQTDVTGDAKEDEKKII